MISENKELSEQKGVACISVVGNSRFYTNTRDEFKSFCCRASAESLSLQLSQEVNATVFVSLKCIFSVTRVIIVILAR